MATVFAPDRWNLGTLAAVTAVLAVAYLVVPHPVVQYGAWLVVFTLWMAWFVVAGVRYLSTAKG